jgi:hypothetical protein
MNITTANIEILSQLQTVINGLTDQEYSKKIDVLSENTIGKHVRHILEFYECLQKGVPHNSVDYDLRNRDLMLETNVEYANRFIGKTMLWISFINADKMMTLIANFSNDADEKMEIQTTCYRELAYNIEHAIHHMAIIKIAIDNDFKHVTLPENFGVAYSTVNYQQTVCAQ